MRTLVPTVLLLSLIPFSLYASARSNSGGLPERVAELEAQVAAMEEVLQYVRVETEEMEGMTGPHWIIEGANVHVRSGSGQTSDDCPSIPSDANICPNLTGLGNLIVGYNERRPGGGFPEIRVGSHNLIVGDFHEYSSYGGFVAGAGNNVTGPVASVCGGLFNRASGLASSVCGGTGNVASGFFSSVSGGRDRSAENHLNWAAGSLFEEN